MFNHIINNKIANLHSIPCLQFREIRVFHFERDMLYENCFLLNEILTIGIIIL